MPLADAMWPTPPSPQRPRHHRAGTRSASPCGHRVVSVPVVSAFGRRHDPRAAPAAFDPLPAPAVLRDDLEPATVGLVGHRKAIERGRGVSHGRPPPKMRTTASAASTSSRSAVRWPRDHCPTILCSHNHGRGQVGSRRPQTPSDHVFVTAFASGEARLPAPRGRNAPPPGIWRDGAWIQQGGGSPVGKCLPTRCAGGGRARA